MAHKFSKYEIDYLHVVKHLGGLLDELSIELKENANIEGREKVASDIQKSARALEVVTEKMYNGWLKEEKMDKSAFWVPFAISVVLIFILVVGMFGIFNIGYKVGVHDEKIGWLEDQVLQIKEVLDERK